MGNNPWKKTYDRRHLAGKPHVIELRDHGLKDTSYDDWNLPVVTYHNRVLESHVTCGLAPCSEALASRVGFTEQGVDAFVAPAYIGQAKFVYMAPLPAEGELTCDHCGHTVRPASPKGNR